MLFYLKYIDFDLIEKYKELEAKISDFLANSSNEKFDDDYLEKMLSIINDRMCDLKRRVIFISKKHKNKVFSRIKKKTSISKLINLQNEINFIFLQTYIKYVIYINWNVSRTTIYGCYHRFCSRLRGS